MKIAKIYLHGMRNDGNFQFQTVFRGPVSRHVAKKYTRYHENGGINDNENV